MRRMKPPSMLPIFLLFVEAAAAASSTTKYVEFKPIRQCTMRGVCGTRGGMNQPCPYSGPPMDIFGEQHRQILAELCPHLFQG